MLLYSKNSLLYRKFSVYHGRYVMNRYVINKNNWRHIGRNREFTECSISANIAKQFKSFLILKTIQLYANVSMLFDNVSMLFNNVSMFYDHVSTCICNFVSYKNNLENICRKK